MALALSSSQLESKMELDNLSEMELEIVIQVIQRDFELKAADKVRLRRQKRILKEADERVTILSNTEFNNNFCIICFRRFWPIFISKYCCYSCHHFMCGRCSVYVTLHKIHVCLLCQKERTLKSMACDWYYDLLRNRFPQDASELVAQSLFSGQGQLDMIMEITDQLLSPELLQKVKGAQISQYRQKIEVKWQEFEERMRRIELTEVNPKKRENAYKQLLEEYKIVFRDVLKDFSQVLYVTLENYSAKLEDSSINVNEQVINTVHEEVEQLIGYQVQCLPDDTMSFVSDAESTASIFGNYHIEDKLAAALVDKIFNDHRSNVLENFDVNFLDNIDVDDKSSTTTFVFRAHPTKMTSSNAPSQSNTRFSSNSRQQQPQPTSQQNRQHLMPPNVSDSRNRLNTNQRMRMDQSDRSSIVTNEHIEVMETLASEYCAPDNLSDVSSDVATSQPSKVDNRSPLKRQGSFSSVSLSNAGLQQALRGSGRNNRYNPSRGAPSNTDSSDGNSRHVCVSRGEQVNLQLELTGVENINVAWTKIDLDSQVILQTNESLEISVLKGRDSISSNLRIWDSKLSDSGLYTAIVNNRPIARFTVKIIENENVPEKPRFRLKLMPANCRSGQSAQFSVEVVGYPEPRVRFYHDSRLIEQNDSQQKYQIDHSVQINRYYLKIHNVTESDAGVYKCVASNFGGVSECTAKLTVVNVNFRFEQNIPDKEQMITGTRTTGNFTSPNNDIPAVPIRKTRALSNSSSVNSDANSNAQSGAPVNHSLHQNMGKSHTSSTSGSELESAVFNSTPSRTNYSNNRTIPRSVPLSSLPQSSENGVMIGRESANEYDADLQSDVESIESLPYQDYNDEIEEDDLSTTYGSTIVPNNRGKNSSQSNHSYTGSQNNRSNYGSQANNRNTSSQETYATEDDNLSTILQRNNSITTTNSHMTSMADRNSPSAIRQQAIRESTQNKGSIDLTDDIGEQNSSLGVSQLRQQFEMRNRQAELDRKNPRVSRGQSFKLNK